MSIATVENTFGAILIGCIIAVFLFGIVTVQCYMYFDQYEEDHISFKALVGAVWLLELGHTIGSSYEIYITALDLIHARPNAGVRYPAFGVVTILGGIITMLVQGFFSYRLYRVLPNPWKFIGTICGLAGVTRCVLSFYTGINGILASRMVDFEREFQTNITVLLVMGSLIDIFIAIAMLYFLVKKREGAIRRLIDRLIAYTIRTGLITSIGATIVVILFRTKAHTLLYLAAYTCLAKLYSNSLLSALNSRAKSRDNLSKSTSGEAPPARLKQERRVTNGSMRRKSFYNKPISIEMKTTTMIENDPESGYYNLPYSPSLNSATPLTNYEEKPNGWRSTSAHSPPPQPLFMSSSKEESNC